MAETIKAVKGFNQDMTCTPTDHIKFQNEEGKTYEEETADIGSHLVLTEWESNGGSYWDEKTWIFKGAKMVVVDGKKIKENTWYGLRNGKVIEIKED